MAKNAGIMYWHRTPPKHYLGYVKEGKVPVIILPGIFGRWAFLKPLGDHISLLGHPVYIVPKLDNNIFEIPLSAKMVREVIDEANLDKVVIVAHSKGGLIGKYLLVHNNKDNVAKGLVAIASPFSGSAMAELVPHKSAKEMDINTKIINYLESHKEANKKIISIIPEFDNTIWHEKGSFLEGAMDNIFVACRGHNKVVNDKLVWKEIVKSLDRLSN